jgi:hypothetical protein
MNGYDDGSGRLAQVMQDWTKLYPYNPNWQEIPEELEPYEFWDEWKHAIDVTWPSEPDLSNPPPMEA